ncbi:MAG TPA: imidazolonepropionase [Candidatus Limnocylindrales bacterium]|nr:imidazolonepropionase [Candidatus Limnocylindrales bacterium]
MTLRLIRGGRAERDQPGLLVVGAAEIVTMAGGLRMGAAQDEPALLLAPDGDPADPRGPAVACWDGRILGVGPRAELEKALEGSGYGLGRFTRLDAAGGTVTPGLIDSHTHLLFGGSREGELVLRQRGADYLEILAAGGGILSTVEATRSASAEALADHGRRWLAEMLAHGATTVEAKSGYGLDLPTELRLLEVAHRLGEEGPIDVLPTWLGAHAVPPEFRGRPDAAEQYTRHLIDEQLPGIAAQGRARFADVFCEQGVFSPDQSRRILEAAARFGLGLRLHADELAPSGGAELAAELGALSADHLARPSGEGLAALASAAVEGHPVVATLLPATTWFLMHDDFAPARELIERGIPVALATDFNPGTSPNASLPLVMTVACLELKLTPTEALAGVTVNAAHALGLGDDRGSIETGRLADLAIWRVPTHRQIPYWVGADLVAAVVKKGRLVYDGRPA